MKRINGMLVGLLLGAFLSPLLCGLVWLVVIIVGMLSIAMRSPFQSVYEFLCWGGNPYLMPVVLLCGGLAALGYVKGPGIFLTRDLG